ncbi:MAG: hypothetical protein AAGI88_24565, partial [Pseudomonadota bacterium]
RDMGGYYRVGALSANADLHEIDCALIRLDLAERGPVRIANSFVVNDSLIVTEEASREIFRLDATANFSINQSIIFLAGRRPVFLLSGEGHNGNFSVNQCIFWGTPSFRNHLDVSKDMIASGDYNVYYVPGGEEVRNRYNKTSFYALSQWQEASGMDANSVYLTDK